MVTTILRTFSESVRGFTTPIRSLHQAAYLLAALTLVSQVLALLRDRLFAHAFGASLSLDLYFAAFRIPDLVFALVASLVSAYVLIPRIASREEGNARRTLSHAASFLLFFAAALSVFLAVAAPFLLSLLFPAYATNEEFVLLTKLLLIQPILLGLSGVLTSVTQVERRFVLFALSPVLYNLGIIGGVLFLYPTFGLAGIGCGVVLGSLAHLLIHVPVVRKAKLLPSLVIPSFSIVRDIAKDSLPRSFALSMSALTTLVLVALAADTAKGSVAVFSLAGNLAAVPLALIGASYATAAFPVLAKEAGEKRSEAFKATLSAAARHLIFWSTVAALLTIVLRAHLVRAIFGTGAFDWDATRLSAAVLGVLIVGLVAQGLVLLASRAFYAARKSWNPLIIQIVGFVVSVGSAIAFLQAAKTYPFFVDFVEALFRIEGVQGTEVVFIALGATAGQLLMGALALITLSSVAAGVAKALARPFFEAAGAGLVGSAAAYGLLSFMGNLAPLTSLVSVFTQGLLAGMVGLIVSAAVLALLENREFKDLFESLKKVASSKALQPSGTVLDDHVNA